MDSIEEQIIKEILSNILFSVGLAVGQPRAEEICEKWSEVIIKSLQATDPKYTKVLIRDERRR